MKKIILSSLIILSSINLHAIERISGLKDETTKSMFIKGEIYFDKPISTSTKTIVFPEFNIDNTYSDEFYGAYIELEHEFYLLPFFKFEMSSYQFQNYNTVSKESSTPGLFENIRYYSFMSTEEKNITAYWEILQGNDMQFNLGGQYKMITGAIEYENTTVGTGNFLTFEKYLPMVYMRADAQFAKGIELTDELSIGIDTEEVVFENLFKMTYYTKIGFIGSIGYRYKHQEFIVKGVDMINNTHGLIIGLGFKY